MSKSRSVLCGLALFFIAIVANQSAKAALFQYDLTIGATEYSFTVDDTATTSNFPYYFSVTNPDGLPDGRLDFYGSAAGGGFQFFIDGDVLNSLFNIGDTQFTQLYTGPASSPTLLTFDHLALTSFDRNNVGSPAFLTVTAVAGVPEPSTWAMMFVGFIGVAFVAYRRSRKSNGALRAA